jgi:glycine/D-amino acid oxidase-like deaminating enzyme
MLGLPTDEVSYWQSSSSPITYPELEGEMSVDVVIVGGGVTGLTVAYLLKQAGKRVAVIEKNRIASGTTNKTTGKITSQHNLIYYELAARLGEKTAKIYAKANQTAVDEIAKLIKKEKFSCDWQSATNYVYTADPSMVKKFRTEAQVAQSFGLPASFETSSPLPFKTVAAVKFTDQAYFNSQKYCEELAARVNGKGSYVFEKSNVTSFSDNTLPSIKTSRGQVFAKAIVVATKIPAAPLVARAAYAALEHPHTSYIVAGKYTGRLKGMYISPDKEHYSILPVHVSSTKQLILIGGENHTPGLGNSSKRYQRLANYAQKHFGISAIQYKWRGMDYLAYDDVPLIGKLYPWSKAIYTATGFHKWGLSTSMVAGIILRDTIEGNTNPWAETFNSMRLKPIESIPRTIAKSFRQ